MKRKKRISIETTRYQNRVYPPHPFNPRIYFCNSSQHEATFKCVWSSALFG